MRKTAFACVVLLTSGMAAALAADVSGTWAIRGPVTPVCTFVQTGNSLGGACRGPGAEGPLSGTIDGESLRWTFTRTNMASGRGIAPLQFSATVNGQSLSGTMTVNGVSPAPFTAQLLAGAPPIQLASAKPAPVAPSSAPVSGPPGLNTTPPRSVFDIDADGSAIHQQSRLICPKSAAGFQRVSTVMYARPGFDVSCGYRAGNAPGSPVVTLYMTVAPRESLDAVFELTKASLVQAAPGVVARTAMTAAPSGFDWRKAGYSLPNGLVTEVFISRLSGWDYKLRTTYQPEDAGAVGALLAALSEGVAKTAAPHLAACAAAPAAPRNGVRNQDREMLPVLIGAAGVTIQLTVLKPRSDTIWCAETGFNVGDRPYVLWRNAAQGADGPVDRIIGITGDGKPILVLRASPDLVDEMAKTYAFKGVLNNRAVHAVVLETDEKFAIVGIYDGRPSLQDVANLVLTQGQNGIPVHVLVDKKDGSPSAFKPY